MILMMKGRERVTRAAGMVNGAALGFLLIGVTESVAAEPALDDASLAQSGQGDGTQTPRRITGVKLDYHSGWSAGLEGYAGLTTYSNTEGSNAHALAGGMARLRWQFLVIGAMAETSDYTNERWRSLGGSVGAFLPFTNWIDVDASVGLAMRNYLSTDRRYSDHGTEAKVPSLALRLGVSDRPLETLIGPRLGAALLIGIDLKQRDVTWSYEYAGKTRAAGVTTFGGVTAGLVVGFGLEVARRNDR
jgi:hypothetical protein